MKLDSQERFLSFNYAKITCGREITGETKFSNYCRGRSLEEILALPFNQISSDLNPKDEESQFILYLEWEALRSVIAQYLGLDDPHLDAERCRITSIECTHEGIETALVIFPPKEIPKILPCGLAK